MRMTLKAFAPLPREVEEPPPTTKLLPLYHKNPTLRQLFWALLFKSQLPLLTFGESDVIDKCSFSNVLCVMLGEDGTGTVEGPHE